MRWLYGIGEYFIGITVASVAVTLIGMLYSDDKGGVRKALDLCLSLCLLCAVIAPMGGMIAEAKEEIDLSGLELPDIDVSADSAIYASLAEASRGEIEEKLKGLIRKRFDLTQDDIEVSASVMADENGIAITKITVWLYGRGVFTDPREIKAFVSGYTDAECEIVNGG